MIIKFYRSGLLAFSLITILLTLISKEEIPKNLVFLPMTFLILIILVPSFTKYIDKYIGIAIVNLTMFIRYLISPFLMTFYGTNMYRGQLLSLDTLEKSVYLMIFEMVVIFLCFAIFHKFFYTTVETETLTQKANTSNFVNLLVLLFIFGIILLYPESLSRYAFVWSFGELKDKTVEGIEYSSILTIVQLGHLMLLIIVINYLYLLYKKNKNINYLIISIIFILVSSSFIVGTSRFSIILPLTTGFYTLYKFYKPFRKLLINISVISILSMIILSTALKKLSLKSDTIQLSIGERLNTELQLYFSGVANVGHALQTRILYEPYNFESVLSDLMRSVVFLNSFFTSNQDSFEAFNLLFYAGGPSRDQILPLIGQGYLYFGVFFAPIFSALVIVIIMFFDKKIKNNNNIFYSFILIYVCVKFALFNMGNMTILISFATNYFLPLLVIYKINNFFQIKVRNRA